MKIEGYLFLPHRGQYRFGFEVHQENGHARYSEIRKSNMAFDYFWDIGMRSRPTLYELINDNPRKAHMREQWERTLLNLFKDKQLAILENKSTYLKQIVADGYVEYRVAE